jgi:hypothetical protein
MKLRPEHDAQMRPQSVEKMAEAVWLDGNISLNVAAHSHLETTKGYLLPITTTTPVAQARG